MKKKYIIPFLGAITSPLLFAKDVYVDGYMRKDGTYVAPHYRSAPDGVHDNSWTTVGNINPYTKQEGNIERIGDINLFQKYASQSEVNIREINSTQSYVPQFEINIGDIRYDSDGLVYVGFGVDGEEKYISIRPYNSKNTVITDPKNAKLYVNKNVATCGVVKQMTRFKKGFYLNLNAHFPDQELTLVAWNNFIDDFEDHDYYKIERLKGRGVCASGIVKKYKGRYQINLSKFENFTFL